MQIKDRKAYAISRKKLNIISQNDKELIVDIEPAEGNVTERGTPINAELLNHIVNRIEDYKIRIENLECKIDKFLSTPDYTEICGNGPPKIEIIDGRLKFTNIAGKNGAIVDMPGRFEMYIDENGNLRMNTSDTDIVD